MNSLRQMTVEHLPHTERCSRCPRAGGRWDRIGGKAYCPHCQEQLASGEGPPLAVATEPQACVVCGRAGTVCFQTFPLHAEAPVEMDLCAEHLRGLLGRRLGPFGYHQLQRQLQALGISSTDMFLLHEAFYDRYGRALQPVQEILW